MSRPGLTTASFESLYLLSNKEDAKDVIQEVFLAAYAKRESFPDINSVE